MGYGRTHTKGNPLPLRTVRNHRRRGFAFAHGHPRKIQDLPYRLLLMLVERPGETVTREDVRQRLWPDNTFVDFDNSFGVTIRSFGVTIRKIREALYDDEQVAS